MANGSLGFAARVDRSATAGAARIGRMRTIREDVSRCYSEYSAQPRVDWRPASAGVGCFMPHVGTDRVAASPLSVVNERNGTVLGETFLELMQNAARLHLQ
jgi:hypothetical protein